jgi:hypothetical protein
MSLASLPLLAALALAAPPAATCPADTVLVEPPPPTKAGAPAGRPFCMELTEVTVGRYQACVAEKRCGPPATRPAAPGLAAADRDFQARWCNAAFEDRENHPINCVGFQQAATFCASQGRRLPTAAEWTWAAQGRGEARPFPWGAEAPDETRANACGAGCAAAFAKAGKQVKPLFAGGEVSGTSAVGAFPAGDARDGMSDLAGNVAELTTTRAGDVGFVVKGGSFLDAEAASLRAAAAATFPATARLPGVGFRCVQDLPKGASARTGGKSEAETHAACQQRADLVFVDRCRQACQIEGKGRTPLVTEDCLRKCGKQPQMGQFMVDCMSRAGFAPAAPARP